MRRSHRPGALLAALGCLLLLGAPRLCSAVSVGGAFGGPTRAGGGSGYWNAAAVGDTPDRWAAMADLMALSFGARYERAGTDPNTGEPFEPVSFDTMAPNFVFTLAAPTPWSRLQVVASGFSPLAQAVFWPKEGPHRYHGVDSRMVTYGATLGLAWHVTDWLTISAGGGPVWGSLHLGYAMDFGAYGNGQLPPGSQPMPLEDPQLEGYIDANATGWGAMATAGIWAHPFPWLRLGVAAILPSDVHVVGDIKLDSSPALDEALPGFRIASTGDLEVDFPLYKELHFEAELSYERWRLGLLTTVYPTTEVRIIRGVISGSEAEFLNGEQISVNDPRNDWLYGLRLSRRLGDDWELGLRADLDPNSIPHEVQHSGNMDFTSIHLALGARWYAQQDSWLELTFTQLILRDNTIETSSFRHNAPPESGMAMPPANGVYSAHGFLVTLGYVGAWGE